MRVDLNSLLDSLRRDQRLRSTRTMSREKQWLFLVGQVTNNMFKKFLIRLIYNLYVGKNRDILKLSPEMEFKCYLFKDPALVEDLIKSRLTVLTLKYFEATSEADRLRIKGAAVELKAIRDNHNLAYHLLDKEKDSKRATEVFQRKKFI